MALVQHFTCQGRLAISLMWSETCATVQHIGAQGILGVHEVRCFTFSGAVRGVEKTPAGKWTQCCTSNQAYAAFPLDTDYWRVNTWTCDCSAALPHAQNNRWTSHICLLVVKQQLPFGPLMIDLPVSVAVGADNSLTGQRNCRGCCISSQHGTIVHGEHSQNYTVIQHPTLLCHQNIST